MKKRFKLSLAAVIAIFTALVVLVNILSVVLAFNLLMKQVYLKNIEEKLLYAMETIQTEGPLSDAVRQFQAEGVAVTVMDRSTGRFLVREGGRREEGPRGGAETDFSRDLDEALGTDTGSFFQGDPKHLVAGPVGGKSITLLARTETLDLRLSCMVGPLDDAIELASQFTVILGLVVFAVTLPAILLLSRRVGRSGKRIAGVAERLSDMDFSQRCPDSTIRDLSVTGESLNTMADRLKENLAELRSANEQMNRELEERERQQRLNSELLANLSHDLKTPIAIISGYAQGITEGIARTPEQTVRYGTMIQRESEHMQGIVSKMLELARSEIHREAPELQDFDLALLVREVLESFQRAVEQEGLDLTAALPETLLVRSDRNRIKQILLNYVQNALYHRSGGNQIRVTLEEMEGMAWVRVANSSPPFDEETRSLIWEKLYRGDAARSRDRGEAGLGLSIVKSSMELLGQPYGVRNLEGMVEFYVGLPTA